MLKRIIAVMLCMAVMLGCLGTGVTAASPILQVQVETELAQLAEAYNGQYYNDNFFGATQCKGFADMIYDALFDVGSIGAYPADIYYMNLFGTHTTEVGRIEPGYTLNAEGVAAIKALLSKALPGDYIQMKRPAGYGHSMIVLGTDDTGVNVLHCNWYGRNLISVDHYTWEQMTNLTTGISLYHYKNYLPAGEYTDVPAGSWFHGHVKYVTQFGLMNGVGSGQFGPNVAMDRSMVVTVLYRMSGDGGTYTNNFADVPNGTFYTNAVGWASENGITTGMTDGTFRPQQTIDRSQLAVFLYRFAQYQGYDTTASADLSQFKDADQIPYYAATALQWAAGEQIFQGSNGMLRPRANATRCEVAKVLAVYHQLLNAPAAADANVCYSVETYAAPELTGMDGLQQQIALQLHSYDGIWSVYLMELSTGDIVSMNEAPMPAGDWIEWFDGTEGYPMTAFAGTANGPDIDLTSPADFGRMLEGTSGEAAMYIANDTNAAWVVPGQYILCVMSDGAGDVSDEMVQLHDLVDAALGK